MTGFDRYAEAHAEPKGPGDARPTAMQVVEDEGLMGKLGGRVMIVTGASSGIGIETARALHAAGAHVIMAVRDREKGNKTAQDIDASNKDREGAGKLEVAELDLASLKSVRQFAQTFKAQHQQLHVLVCNAGIMACPESKTEDGFEMQFGTNHLGHFLLFQLLKDTLLATASPQCSARVVCVSSLGHRSASVRLDDPNFEKDEYNPWVGYGQAKTANIWMANEIERRYGGKGLHATSLMPGVIMTPLTKHMGDDMKKRFMENERMAKMLKSPEQGAANTVWAAIGAEWESQGGKYLESMQVAPPADESKDLTPFDPGYKSYAYDEDGAKQLWEMSANMVDVEE